MSDSEESISSEIRRTAADLRAVDQLKEEIQTRRDRLFAKLCRLKGKRNFIRNEEEVKKRRVEEGPKPYNRKDANGDILRVGDKVLFLTKGTTESTEGIVRYFGTDYCTSVDSHGNLVDRKYKNIQIIVRKENMGYLPGTFL